MQETTGLKIITFLVLLGNTTLLSLAKLLWYTRVLGGRFECCGGNLWVLEILGSFFLHYLLEKGVEKRKKHYLLADKKQSGGKTGGDTIPSAKKEYLIHWKAILYTLIIFNAIILIGFLILCEIIRPIILLDWSFTASSTLPIIFIFILG